MATNTDFPSSKKPRFFYGYWIIAATFFCAFMDSGCGYYSFSLFVTPLEADFGWGRGGIMFAWTLRFFAVAAVSPFVGRLVDSYGAKKIIPLGALIAGLGFVLLSRMSNLWYFYIGWAAIGAGMAAAGIIPASAVVSNWFKKRRGTALGMMGVGFGAGGILSPLIGGYLIPNFGWRVSYFTLALLMWMAIPLALLVIRAKPADMGLYPDGVEAPEAEAEVAASPVTPKGATLKMALATSSFWLIAASFLVACMGETGINQSQVPYLEDIGFPAAMAATTLAVVGVGSAIGKFIFGWLCDHIQAKYARCIGLSLLLAGAIIITNVRPASPPGAVWLYALLFGLGIGSWLPTMSMLISTNFGLASYGIIFGMVTAAQSVGNGLGPLFAGHMYDSMGTYHWAFIIFIILFAVVAIPAVLAVRRPKSL